MYKIKKTHNGLTMIASRMAHMESVSIGVWVAAGGRYESKRESGISHFLEHMLFKGTVSRSAKELKRAIEGIGGIFNGFTSDEVTCYLVKLPAKFLDLGLDILSDMVLNSSLKDEDIKREKHVISEEIKMYRDNPSDHVMERLEAIMWPDNSLGRPLTGTLGTLRSIGKEDLNRYKENMYHPANMALVACGQLKEKYFFDRGEQIFGRRASKKPGSFKKAEISQDRPRISLSKRDIKQTHIALGFPVRKLSHEKRLAAKLMNIVLGGNMSSRLFEELRDKYGLCYDISSAFKRNKDVSHLHVHAGVDIRNMVRSIAAIMDELCKLKDLGVTEDELLRAKKYAKGNFLLAMEATSSRMLWLGDRYMIDSEIPSTEYVLNAVESITRNDVKDVLKEVFRSDRTNVSVVGNISRSDRSKIQKQLRKL